MNDLSRRELLAGTAATSLTAASTSAFAQQSAGAPPQKENVVNLDCSFISVKLPVSVEGQKALKANTATPSDFIPCQLRAYNKTIPGPLMTVYPGQTLIINVKNSLPPYPGNEAWEKQAKGDHNVPHHLGSTNLHLHGMDIIPHLFDPIGTSNPTAPMIEIPPGGSLQYKFEIPKNHPCGLDWYHPHHHGSTAVQAVSGMAGGIVVMGPIDDVPAIKAAKNIYLVVQDIGLFPVDPPVPAQPGVPGSPGTTPQEIGLPAGTDISNVWVYEPKQNAIWQTFGVPNSTAQVTIYDPTTKQAVPQPQLKGGFTTGDYALRYYLCNGEPFYKETHNAKSPTDPIPLPLIPPRFTMAPGEVVRFRMLNGCSDNYMPIAVEGHTMHLLALDGVNFPAVRPLAPVPIPEPPILTPPSNPDVLKNEGQIQLAPANRAEFLIKAIDKPGTYKIVQLAQNQQFLFSAQKTIAEIEVTGTSKIMALPTALPVPSREYPLIKPSEVQVMRTIFFADQFPGSVNPFVGIDFLLNGQQYDVTAINYAVNVTGVEEWHLIVGDSQHGGTEGHPFHIHVNSFEVISVNGKALEPGTIKDTIWIPAESKVVIRMKFKEFIGKSVFHCHILPHEDTGMMQNFLIKKPGEPVPVALNRAPMMAPNRLTAEASHAPDGAPAPMHHMK